MPGARLRPISGPVDDIDVNFGSTVHLAHDSWPTKGARMTITDLQLSLRRLGFDRPGEVFWLTTTPEITDEELALRLSCL